MIESLVEPNQRLLQQILSSLPVAALIIDIEGKIIYYNLMAEYITGYSPDEMVEKSCSLLRFTDCRMPCTFLSAAGQHNPCLRKSSLRRKDGSHIAVERGVYPLKDDQGRLIGALETLLDVSWIRKTDQCASECLRILSLQNSSEVHLRKMIERSKNKLLGIFDEIIDSLFMIDHEYRIKAVNKTQAFYLGKTPKDLIEKYCYQVIANRSSHCPACKAPAVFQEGVTKTDLNIPFDNDCRCSKSARENRRYVNIHYIPIKTELGQVHNVLVYTQDISKIKELEEGVRRAENLAGLGILASGVAHEINNPLQVILSGANYLIKKADDREIIVEIASQVKECAEKMANIIKDLSLYIRGIQNQKVSLIDISQVLEESITMSSHVRNMQAIEIQRDYQETGLVPGNFNQFQQIFVNLIINAVDAMQGRGTIRLETHQQDNFVHIRIQDTGCGISQENLPYIFDPFFTTKDPGKGTGLGLNVVYRLVNQYKGDIQVKTRREEGTSFLLRFPAATPSHEGENHGHGS
ncbi:MAG: ATP-binding protein [bacterium]